MKNGLFIFHRDFRIIDNNSLNKLNKEVDNIYCCFIFTPEQVSIKNKYRSLNSIQFMMECLYDWREQIKKYNSKLMFFFWVYR